MAIKNIISTTHANDYNCTVIEETGNAIRKTAGRKLIINRYTYVCLIARVIIYARGKDVHHNTQKSGKMANG